MSSKKFERPPLAEIIRRDVSDYEYELGTQNPRLPGTIEHALVKGQSGAAHGLHGRIDRVRQDAFIATSTDEAMVAKAAMFGVYQIPALRSTGTIRIAGTNGEVVPVNTAFVRTDGAVYVTTSSAAAEGEGIALCPARAAASGAAGNMPPGTRLALVDPLPAFEPAGVALAGGWQSGLEPESFASLRRRLKKRLADPPKGGGPGDYERWALGDADESKVPPGALPPGGVTRAWEYGKVPKIGNVTVLIMTDGEDDPFPTPEKLEQVKQWILLFAPIHLPPVIVLSPIPKPLNPTIELTLEEGADLNKTKTAITQALLDMIAMRTAKGAGAEPPAGAGIFYKSWLSEAISSAPGELDHKVTVPAGDVALDQWELVELGTITWASPP